MRALAFVLLAAALPAHADLYRWIDPESGSPKFSSSPPPWYETGSGPAVERIPSARPAAGRTATPEKPAAPLQANALEAQWRAVLLEIARLPPQADPNNESVRQQLSAYQSLTEELDRVDPAGRGRRAAEQLSILQKAKR